MSTPTVDYANVPLPEVRVMTHRLLSAETTEKILNDIDVIHNLRQINMSGESLPRTINSGPAKGLANNHTERKVIHVNGHEVERARLPAQDARHGLAVAGVHGKAQRADQRPPLVAEAQIFTASISDR